MAEVPVVVSVILLGQFEMVGATTSFVHGFVPPPQVKLTGFFKAKLKLPRRTLSLNIKPTDAPNLIKSSLLAPTPNCMAGALAEWMTFKAVSVPILIVPDICG
jgi:hypothetical protein